MLSAAKLIRKTKQVKFSWSLFWSTFRNKLKKFFLWSPNEFQTNENVGFYVTIRNTFVATAMSWLTKHSMDILLIVVQESFNIKKLFYDELIKIRPYFSFLWWQSKSRVVLTLYHFNVCGQKQCFLYSKSNFYGVPECTSKQSLWEFNLFCFANKFSCRQHIGIYKYSYILLLHKKRSNIYLEKYVG